MERFRILDHQELNPWTGGTPGLTWRRNGTAQAASMVRWKGSSVKPGANTGAIHSMARRSPSQSPHAVNLS